MGDVSDGSHFITTLFAVSDLCSYYHLKKLMNSDILYKNRIKSGLFSFPFGPSKFFPC